MKYLRYLLFLILPFYVYAEETIEQIPNEDITLTEQNDSFISNEEDIENENSVIEEGTIIEENTNKLVLIDNANIFTTEEEQLLIDYMHKLTTYGHIIVMTINENSYHNTEWYAKNYYYDNYANTSGIMFLIDMAEREIYIVSDGAVLRYITPRKASIITDNIYKYASQKEYYKCASKALEQIYTILNGGKISEPMRYISNALIAVILGSLTSFIIIASSNKLKSPSLKETIKNSYSKVSVANVVGIKTGTHSVYNPPSSSSSGGSSSGGGGGGHSFGGGGGHRF